MVRVVPEKTPFASESWAVNVLPAVNAPVVEKGTKKLPPIPAQIELDDKALTVIVCAKLTLESPKAPKQMQNDK
ncbi:hypothetical protein GCM10028806_48460 [Spirosoma terrae]